MLPLFVKFSKIKTNGSSNNDGTYYYRYNVSLKFYKDRNNTPIESFKDNVSIFIDEYEIEYNHRTDSKNRGNIISEYKKRHNEKEILVTNKSSENLDDEISYYEQSGPRPTGNDQMCIWNATQYDKYYILRESLFFILLK